MVTWSVRAFHCQKYCAMLTSSFVNGIFILLKRKTQFKIISFPQIVSILLVFYVKTYRYLIVC